MFNCAINAEEKSRWYNSMNKWAARIDEADDDSIIPEKSTYVPVVQHKFTPQTQTNSKSRSMTLSSSAQSSSTSSKQQESKLKVKKMNLNDLIPKKIIQEKEISSSSDSESDSKLFEEAVVKRAKEQRSNFNTILDCTCIFTNVMFFVCSKSHGHVSCATEIRNGFS